MNPYDFVRIEWKQGVARRPAAPHDRFTDGLCGRLEGTITTLTPLFIPQTENLKQKEQLLQRNRPIGFTRNKRDEHIIPGSSLKGLFRSLVETVGPGCWWLFDGKYRDNVNYINKLPNAFKQCPRTNPQTQEPELCVACRLFGLISSNTGTLLLGKVGFEDAVCDSPIEHDPLYTPIFDTPKPRHDVWYLDSSKRRVTGRKFYFHFTDIIEDTRLRPIPDGGYRNTYIHPVGPGSVFPFSAHFNNITPDEWPVLHDALPLEREHWRHDHISRPTTGPATPAAIARI